MDEAAIVSIVFIVFGSIIVALLIVSRTIARVLGGRSGGHLSEEESQLMQELFYGMKKMEERVESLETILLDRDRKRGGG